MSSGDRRTKPANPRAERCPNSIPVVAVIGGIGCGKSVLAEHISQHRVPVIDTDHINSDLLDEDPVCREQIGQLFGAQVFDRHGHIDRKLVADSIFTDDEKRRRLEEIMHPKIQRTARLLIDRLRAQKKAPYIVLLVPLPPVCRQDWLIDWVLFVRSTVNNRIQRLTKNRAMSVDQAQTIIAAQPAEQLYQSMADTTIDNDATLEQFYRRIDYQKLIERWGVKTSEAGG